MMQSIVAWEYTLRLFSISMAMMALTDTIWYVAKSKWSNMCGPPERQPLTRVHKQAIYFCAIFYNTTLGMVKLSVLSLYRRILAGIPSRTLPIINWTAFGIVSVNTTINVCVAAFQCRPIAAAFDNSVKGKCINQAAFYLGNASTGIFTDVMVYGLSIPIVKPLQMDPKKKLQTLLTLLMGGFAVITSCVRMGFLPALLKDADTTYAMAIPMAWSVAEPTLYAGHARYSVLVESGKEE
ncbi:hypothetical protein SLS57_011864 [Botryosphaeria dothidea]